MQTSQRQRAAQERAARERARRVAQALAHLPALEAKKKPADQDQARVSTTDPDARVMKMADGGFRPAARARQSRHPPARHLPLGRGTPRGPHHRDDRDRQELRGPMNMLLYRLASER